MEEHLDKIIYIIIAVVAFIISAVNKAKKKQQQAMTPASKPVIQTQESPKNITRKDETAIPKSEIETLFEMLNPQEKSIEYQESKIETLEELKLEEVNLENEVNSIESLEEGVAQMKLTDQPTQVVEETVEEPFEFNAKQAIIYSEILKRKYA